MSADASKITVIESLCDACGTTDVQVCHQSFPELQVTGTSAEQAARQLAQRLSASLDAVSDPSYREPVRRAVDDLRAFLDREGAPHRGRDL
jgi:hypothetical protein